MSSTCTNVWINSQTELIQNLALVCWSFLFCLRIFFMLGSGFFGGGGFFLVGIFFVFLVLLV